MVSLWLLGVFYLGNSLVLSYNNSMQNSIQSSSIFNLCTMQTDLLGLFIKNVGQIRAAEAQFESVPSSTETPVQQQEQDFGFEEEQGTGPISAVAETDQLFMKSIGLSTIPGVSKSKPQGVWSEMSVLSYGFVAGDSNLVLLRGKECKTVGVNIYFEGSIYQGHNYQISYIKVGKDNKEGEVVISGTGGKCPEVKVWGVSEQDRLQVLGGMNLPMSSLGVSQAWFQNSSLMVISKYNLHQSSQLYAFRKALTKQSKRSNVKTSLGKVISHISTSTHQLILNQKGVHFLSYNQQQNIATLTLLLQSAEDEHICCMEMVNDQLIVLGYLDGSVAALQLGNNIRRGSKVQIHLKQVVAMAVTVDYQLITAAGNHTLALSRIENASFNIQKIKQTTLPSPATKIVLPPLTPLEQSFKVLLRNGQTSTLSLAPLTLLSHLPQLSTPSSALVYPPPLAYTQTQPCLLYNKYLNKHIYSLNNSNFISLIEFDPRGGLNNSKKLRLTNIPQVIDIHGNIAAYVYIEQKQHNYKTLSGRKSAISTINYKSTLSAQINIKNTLVLEEYLSQKVLSELQLPQGHHCTCIRFNPAGDKLALGLSNGSITIYNVAHPLSPLILKSSPFPALHIEPISAIIWSVNSLLLKTISQSNLIYYDIGTAFSPIYSSKAVQKDKWPQQCGKFDYVTYQIWAEHRHHPTDITDIISSQHCLWVCNSNGSLQVYNRPSGKQGKQMVKMFNQPFKSWLIHEQNNMVVLAIANKGALITIVIGPTQQSEQEDEEDGSFEEQPYQ